MTIARRLALLVAVPLLVLGALGVFSMLELSRIESRSRFVAEYQVRSLAALGNITRTHGELRIALRDYLLLGADPEGRSRVRAAFEAGSADSARRLQDYAASLISDVRDGELLSAYRAASGEWNGAARRVMSLADDGKPSHQH